MDLNLKQWKHESEEEQSSKIPRQHQQQVAALPLFVSAEISQPISNKITTHLSSYTDNNTPTAIPTSTPRFSKIGMGGKYSFSWAQWQELELQALIYRHMVAGASVPAELLQLVKKSLFTSSTAPYYLHHYSPYFQPPVAAALLQAGYWGKGAMDPEPGRCRRTDGKKWRCSRDVVAGHKYCERHMHRGRNRSRKPVEFPAAASNPVADALVGSLHKPANTNLATGSVGAKPQISLSMSGVSSPLDSFQLTSGASNRRTLCEPQLESSSTSRDGVKSNKVLMHFFDDYQRSEDGNDNNLTSSTSLSMSTSRNPSSDFLRLSTGNGDEVGSRDGSGNENEERGQHMSWGASGWGGNPVGSMGGPLAEALRSSSNSSPTSVLHQLPRCSGTDTSLVSV